MRPMRSLCSLALVLMAAGPCLAAGGHDPREYGAKADGRTLATAAIQKAIDACAAEGGGTVRFAPGIYLSGTLRLKSHVTLELEAGCTLPGSPDPADYPDNLPKIRSYTDTYVRRSLIAGEGLEQVAIRGRGTIDGQAAKFHWPEYCNRPYVIRLVDCRDGGRRRPAPQFRHVDAALPGVPAGPHSRRHRVEPRQLQQRRAGHRRLPRRDPSPTACSIRTTTPCA